MSGDYKPNYNSSPSRKRAIIPNKEQASIYRYQMNNNVINSNNNINHSNNTNNHNVLSDMTKYYNNQSNIRNRTTTTTTTSNNNNVYNRINSNSNSNGNNNNNNIYISDSDIEDDQDYTYSDNSRSLDFSTEDFISGNNPRKLKESLSLQQQQLQAQQLLQQQQQQQHQTQNILPPQPNQPINKPPSQTHQHQHQQQQQHNSAQNTTTNITTQNQHQKLNKNRQSQNIFQRFIIQPLQNFYYGKNSVLRVWPVDTKESNKDDFCIKMRTIFWVAFFSILSVLCLLGFLATKHHGINIYFPNTTSSSSPMTTIVENTITKEQLIPMLEDYFKQSKIFNNLENNIKELSKSNNKENQEIIKELKNEINLIKLSNLDEERVNKLIVKMIDHYNDNENNKKELRQVLENAIKEFNQFEKEKFERFEKKTSESLNIYQSKTSESLNKLSSTSEEQLKEFTNQFNALLSKKFEELDSRSKQQLSQLSQESNSLINKQSEKLKQYQVELDSNGKEKVGQLLSEYQSLETQLKEFTSKLEKSMSTNIQSIFNEHKTAITKDFNKQVSEQSIVINNQANHLTAQYNQITNQFTKIQQFIDNNPSIESIHKTISSLEGIKLLIDDILEVYSADKIAKVDYALLESGASIENSAKYYKVSKSYPTFKEEENIIQNDPLNQKEKEESLSQQQDQKEQNSETTDESTTTSTKSNTSTSKKSLFNIYLKEFTNTAKDLFYLSTSWLSPREKVNGPSTILEPTVNTGSCWAFYGSQGQVVIRLAKRIKVNEVTMEHINTLISHHIESAPKQFQVIGLLNSDDIGTDLGVFTYNTTINRHLQTFKVLETDKEYSHIVLKVLSNYGYKYTCIYRFRVHGIQVEHPESEQLIPVENKEDQFIKNVEESIQNENNQNKISQEL